MLRIDDIEQYYEQSDKTFLSLVRNNKFEKILGAMGRFGIFGIKNILLILQQDENASYVNSARGWNFNGRYVIPAADPIRIVKKEYSKDFGSDEETATYIHDLVYDHKWTKKASCSSRKDSEDFTHVFSADRVLKYPKGLLNGICQWAEQNCKAKGEEADLIRNDLKNLKDSKEIGIEEVKKGVDFASILVSMEVCDKTYSLSRYPEFIYVVQNAAKYILAERLELDRPKITLDHGRYSDTDLKEGLLKALYPLRASTQKIIRKMEIRAYNQEVNEHFEKMRQRQIAQDKQNFEDQQNDDNYL